MYPASSGWLRVHCSTRRSFLPGVENSLYSDGLLCQGRLPAQGRMPGHRRVEHVARARAGGAAVRAGGVSPVTARRRRATSPLCPAHQRTTRPEGIPSGRSTATAPSSVAVRPASPQPANRPHSGSTRRSAARRRLRLRRAGARSAAGRTRRPSPRTRERPVVRGWGQGELAVQVQVGVGQRRMGVGADVGPGGGRVWVVPRPWSSSSSVRSARPDRPACCRSSARRAGRWSARRSARRDVCRGRV